MFRHIWNNADDGMWSGDAAIIAAEFNVSEDEAHEEICDAGHIEKVYPGTYAVVRWWERDDAGEEELL